MKGGEFGKFAPARSKNAASPAGEVRKARHHAPSSPGPSSCPPRGRSFPTGAHFALWEAHTCLLGLAPSLQSVVPSFSRAIPPQRGGGGGFLFGTVGHAPLFGLFIRLCSRALPPSPFNFFRRKSFLIRSQKRIQSNQKAIRKHQKAIRIKQRKTKPSHLQLAATAHDQKHLHRRRQTSASRIDHCLSIATGCHQLALHSLHSSFQLKNDIAIIKPITTTSTPLPHPQTPHLSPLYSNCTPHNLHTRRV